MAGGCADLHSRDDGQVRRIFGKVALGHRDIVVGDRDEGEICLFGCGHHFRYRPAAVGCSGMNVDHANPLIGVAALRQDRKLDEEAFQHGPGDYQD